MSERTVTVRLRALISDYQKAMQTAAGESKKFASTVKGNFTQLNQDVGKLGETMTRRVTLPLVGVGVGAVKLAGDFETTFGQMVGLAGVAADEVDGLRESVLKLSKDTARGPNELAQALYFVRSSGIDASHAMGVVEVAAKAAAAGLGSTVVVADAVTSAMNAYGAANLSAQQATDVLVAAVREGKTEASELAPVLGVLIPTAAAMGISFAQVAGTLAVMSRTGLDAAEASTSLNAIFSTLLGTSKEGTDTLASAGLSLGQLRDMAAGPGGLVSVMRLLDGTFKGNDEALAKIIPNVRAFRGVMNVLAQDGASVDQVMQNVANSTGATNDAFAAMKSTEAFKTKQAIVKLQIALLRLGAALQPIVSQFVGGIADIASAFSTLPHWLQETVVWLGLVAVAAGPAMRAFQLASSVAVPAIQFMIRAVQGLQVQLALARMEGLSTGQALKQMAVGAAPAVLATTSVIAAGVGVIYAWSKAKADARQRTLEFVAALEADNGALGANSEALIRNKIAQGDLNDNLTRAGITYDQFVNALKNGGAAGQAVINQLVERGHLNGQELIALGNLIQMYRTGTREMQQNAAAGITAAGAIDAKTQADMDTANAAIAAAQAALEHSNAMTFEEAAADAAEKQLRALLGTLNALYSGAFAVADAQQGYADALADVDASQRSTSGSARDLTSQQRTLEKATKDVTEAQQGLAEAEKNLELVRKGATPREKQDAALDVRDAKVGVTAATKALADAKKRLAEEQKKGKQGDVAGARIDVEQADIGLARAKLRLTDAQKAQNDVNNAGKAGSKSLADATKQLEDAQDRLADTTERQNDAEAQLRSEGSSGGPVADRARQLRSAYDRLVTSSQNVITEMANMKRPAGEIITELDKQSASAQHLIDVYGDPDGKLQKFIDNNNAIKAIFADQKFKDDAKIIARAVGVIVTGSGVIIDMGGGDDSFAGGRAKGGPVKPFTTYEMGEEGPEALTFGATRQPKSFDMAPPDKLGKGAAAELSGRSAMGARTFMVGLAGPQFITMGAQGGWVTPNDKLGDIGARAAGGPVLPGRTYLVGERGPEILTVGGFWQQRIADPTAGQSVTNYVTQGDSVTPGYGNGDAQTGGAATVAVSVADGPYRMTEQGPVMLVPTPGASGANTSSMYATATNSATTLSTATTYTVGLNGPEVITMGSLPGWVHSDVHLLEGRAKGGPVAAGQTVVVGENGPEIITVGGMVTSRHSAGSTPDSTRMASASATTHTSVRSRERFTERIRSILQAIQDRTTDKRATDTTERTSERVTDTSAASKSTASVTRADSTVRDTTSDNVRSESVRERSSDTQRSTVEPAPLPTLPATPLFHNAVQQAAQQLGLPPIDLGLGQAQAGPYRMTERGPVPLVPTSRPGRSARGEQTFIVGVDGPEVITMGSEGGYVHPDIDVEGRAKGGPVAPGQTVVVGERGPERLTIGGNYSSTNSSSMSRERSSVSSMVVDKSTASTARDYIAAPWAGPMMAAPSVASPVPIALEVNVAVQGDFVKMANELIRLSKQNGGLPIRIRSAN